MAAPADVGDPESTVAVAAATTLSGSAAAPTAAAEAAVTGGSTSLLRGVMALPPWWALVAVVLLCSAVVAGAVWWTRRRQHRTAHQHMLATHLRLRRTTSFCNDCWDEFQPYSTRLCCYLCGDFERCVKCNTKPGAVPHEHDLHPEVLYPAVERLPIEQATSCAQALDASFRLYGDRPCLGWRERSGPNGDTLARRFTWLSHTQVRERSLAFGSGLVAMGLAQPRQFVALISANHISWFLTDYGCVFKSVVSVALHYTLAPDQWSAVLDLTKCVAIVTSKHLKTKALAACARSKLHTVQHIIEIDDPPHPYALLAPYRDDDVKADAAGAAAAPPPPPKCIAWRDVEVYGATRVSRKERERLIPTAAEAELSLLCTSGTSGAPKCAILTDANHLASITAVNPLDPFVICNFEPMSHSYGRKQTVGCLSNGGCVGIYSGAMDVLLEDLQLLRPTLVGSTPQFWNGLYQTFLGDLQREGDQFPADDRHAVRERVLKRMRSRKPLGDRVKLVVTGGAPTARDVLGFLWDLTGAVVIHGYGCTETGGIYSNGARHNQAHDIRLVDCPELNYFTTDLPHPRGEVCAATKRLIPGYYGDAELTRQSFVELDGRRYFRTGDIGELRADGTLTLIDRKRHIFKLAQGEFVAPERLETLYLACPYVEQIFVTGDSTQSCVMAVVVPSPALVDEVRRLVAAAAGAAAADAPTDAVDLQTVCNPASGAPHRTALRVLRAALRATGRTARVEAWEIPQLLLLERVPFSVENGLRTATNKTCRHALQRHYKDALGKLVADMKSQSAAADSKGDGGADLDGEDDAKAPGGNGRGSATAAPLTEDDPQLLPAFRAVLRQVLPAIPALSGDDSLLELGADSLVLARAVELLNTRFGCALSLPALARMGRLLDVQSYLLQTATNRDALASAASSGGGGSAGASTGRNGAAAVAAMRMPPRGGGVSAEVLAAVSGGNVAFGPDTLVDSVDWRSEIDRHSDFGVPQQRSTPVTAESKYVALTATGFFPANNTPAAHAAVGSEPNPAPSWSPPKPTAAGVPSLYLDQLIANELNAAANEAAPTTGKEAGGPDALAAFAVDLKQQAQEQAAARAAARHRSEQALRASAVLVTGATGFLGAFVLNAVLRAPVYRGRRVYCIVRPTALAPRAVTTATTTAAAAGSDGKVPPAATSATGEDDADARARARVVDNLQYYGLWDGVHAQQLVDADRLVVLSGDVSRDRFGLSETPIAAPAMVEAAQEAANHEPVRLAPYDVLVCDVSVVYHVAAMVNSVLPYRAHARHNVRGTQQVIRFALRDSPRFGAGVSKVLNHVSTAGVLLPDIRTEDRPLNYTAQQLNTQLSGYSQSKWVAEQLVLRARAAPYHLKANIFRPPTISGHSVSGASNARDFVNLILKGLIELGLVTGTDTNNAYDCPLPQRYHLVPADYVASAIVSIGSDSCVHCPPSPPAGPKPTSSGGGGGERSAADDLKDFLTTPCHVYHLCNSSQPQQQLSLRDLVAFVRAHGYELESVSPDVFRAHVSRLTTEHPLFFFKSALSGRGFGSRDTRPDDTNTLLALQALHFRCPKPPVSAAATSSVDAKQPPAASAATAAVAATAAGATSTSNGNAAPIVAVDGHSVVRARTLAQPAPWQCPPITQQLMSRYFDHFVAKGLLKPKPKPKPTSSTPSSTS